MDLLRDNSEHYYVTRRRQIFKTLNLLLALTPNKTCSFGGGGGGRVIQELSQQIDADIVEISLLPLTTGIASLSLKTKPMQSSKPIALLKK